LSESEDKQEAIRSSSKSKEIPAVAIDIMISFRGECPVCGNPIYITEDEEARHSLLRRLAAGALRAQFGRKELGGVSILCDSCESAIPIREIRY